MSKISASHRGVDRLFNVIREGCPRGEGGEVRPGASHWRGLCGAPFNAYLDAMMWKREVWETGLHSRERQGCLRLQLLIAFEVQESRTDKWEHSIMAVSYKEKAMGKQDVGKVLYGL
jgi:hypothetical protein